MTAAVFEHNRVILFHFDTYSALLSFARFGKTMLVPGPLPDASLPIARRAADERHERAPVLDAVASHFGLPRTELRAVEAFDEWAHSDAGPLRIHLVRIETFEPPREQLVSHEGTFKPVSEMRGVAPHELGYARQIFDLVMGGH